MDALIAHVVFNLVTETYKQGNNNVCEEVESTLIPFSPYPYPRRDRDITTSHSTKLKIYPNSGATICLGVLKRLRHSQKESWSTLEKKCASLEDFPWCVKVACLLHSKLESDPRNRRSTYEARYR